MKDHFVITIGGANLEHFVRIEKRHLEIGVKHSISPTQIFAGGSAVVHACRLLATGIQVIPIIPIVNDFGGNIIKKNIEFHSKKGGVDCFEKKLFMKKFDMTTSIATIFSLDNLKTIYTDHSSINSEEFSKYCFSKINILNSKLAIKNVKSKIAIIGHIHADNFVTGKKGEITRSTINTLKEANFFILANFGSSQYNKGYLYWSPTLEKIHCFQLNIREIKVFMSASEIQSDFTLKKTFDLFRNKCTVIITLGKMGTIAQVKHSNSIIFSWPYKLDNDEIIDTTGAGNSMIAGIASYLVEHQIETDEHMSLALTRGTLWSAFACTQMGSSDNCPNNSELNHFRMKHQLLRNVEIKNIEDSIRDLEKLEDLFKK